MAEVTHIRNTTSSPPFDVDAAVAHLARKDRTLARLIREVGPCRLEIATRQSPYQALLESIVYQQLTGKVPPALQVAAPRVGTTLNIGGPICSTVVTVQRAA